MIRLFTDIRSWSETVSLCRAAEALRPERWDDLWQQWQAERVYCHPDSPAVRALVRQAVQAGRRHSDQVHWLFQWCRDQLRYGRLAAPWFPLVRTDEDVLRLREGTCGDYAHLLVACATAMGIEARYVWVDRDVYGDEQNHICSAFLEPDEGRWVLVDPTYFTGWDVRHRDVRFVPKEAHWAAVSRDEFDWLRGEAGRKRLALAGLTYAPWVYEGLLERADLGGRTFFALLCVTAPGQWGLWATLHEQRPETRACPVRLRATAGGALAWDLCHAPAAEVWDEARWAAQGAVTPGAVAENPALREASAHYEQLLPRLRPIVDAVETFAAGA